ncbi:unnamed protein product [Nippostrongylus brasiliensis]|uniref:CLASP_N domain-containing protein n=1 Tax=Nippostrongylus brasiliensis TaxID=27835 RepID=A0A0N4Y6Q2_NIPBR|nr:unnamed protein product [Nippostrongylus brasiliensis]
MVARPDGELDELTDEFLALMLNKREFIEKWTLNVEAELSRREADTVSQSETRSAPSVPSKVFKPEDRLVPTLTELVHALDASTQTFLSSADFNICHSEPEHNRDASLLFAARLQIDRMISKTVDRKCCEAGARRLLQLVRLFSSRISSWVSVLQCVLDTDFQLPNTSSFATSLCDMFYTFCDSTSSVIRPNEQEVLTELTRATDDFNEIVVEKLSTATFEAQYARRNAAKPLRQQFFSPQPARLRRPLVQIQQRSPGYLLPLDLQKVPTLFLPFLSHVVVDEQDGIAQTVKVRLDKHSSESRKDAQEPDQNEAVMRLAKKISQEVVKDLRRKYGSADIGVLGI